MAMRVRFINRPVDVAHMLRYTRQRESLHSGVVSLKTHWLMKRSLGGHGEVRVERGMLAFSLPWEKAKTRVR